MNQNSRAQLAHAQWYICISNDATPLGTVSADTNRLQTWVWMPGTTGPGSFTRSRLKRYHRCCMKQPGPALVGRWTCESRRDSPAAVCGIRLVTEQLLGIKSHRRPSAPVLPDRRQLGLSVSGSLMQGKRLYLTGFLWLYRVSVLRHRYVEYVRRRRGRSVSYVICADGDLKQNTCSKKLSLSNITLQCCSSPQVVLVERR